MSREEQEFHEKIEERMNLWTKMEQASVEFFCIYCNPHLFELFPFCLLKLELGCLFEALETRR